MSGPFQPHELKITCADLQLKHPTSNYVGVKRVSGSKKRVENLKTVFKITIVHDVSGRGANAADSGSAEKTGLFMRTGISLS